MHQFKGIYAPIATPFNGDSIDWPGLKKNLDFYNQSKLAGLVVLGSNGEFALLNRKEKLELIAFVREHLSKDKKMIAGTGCETTQEVIDLSNECADLGADAALIVNPWYYKGSYNDAVLANHFTKIANQVKMPIMLYNMPRNTSISMSANLIAQLAQHPNIVGVKDSGGDIVQITNIIRLTPANFSVFAGSGSFLYPTLAMGGVGGTLAIANILPDFCADLAAAAQAGQHEKAVSMQKKIMELNAAVTSKYGIPGLKKAMDLIGLVGGTPREPLLPVDEGKTADIKRLLAEFDL
ncbi:MAG: dihydrodipicolinate synthase family protein [Firmicutes bacterium]|jgi:4-hydroxy-2-oxoglutarate aldolase|nr:dihydrodipicolinate synthase family protein [Bacillota bacterium]